MIISLFSKNGSHPELKTPRTQRGSFTTYVDLNTLRVKELTFKDLFDAVICDFCYNPPRKFKGVRWEIGVRQIRYWAKLGSYCSVYTIQFPLKNPHKRFPPLAKLNGSFRVLFCTNHSWIREEWGTEEYPKDPRARLRHIGERNMSKSDKNLLRARYETARIYQLS